MGSIVLQLNHNDDDEDDDGVVATRGKRWNASERCSSSACGNLVVDDIMMDRVRTDETFRDDRVLLISNMS